MKRAYRKKAFPLSDIRRFLEPGPIVLVSSAWHGASNVMTMGWHMMLGFSPALFSCYIWDENHSYDMLRRSRQCVINLPTADLIEYRRGHCQLSRQAPPSSTIRSSWQRYIRL